MEHALVSKSANAAHAGGSPLDNCSLRSTIVAPLASFITPVFAAPNRLVAPVEVLSGVFFVDCLCFLDSCWVTPFGRAR